MVRFGGDAAKAAAVHNGMKLLSADAIANGIAWLTDQLQHLNVNTIEFMPTAQSVDAFQIHRDL